MRRQSPIHTWPDEHMAECFCSCEVGEGASLITSASNGPAESARGSLTMLEAGPLSLSLSLSGTDGSECLFGGLELRERTPQPPGVRRACSEHGVAKAWHPLAAEADGHGGEF